jgi:hypothetical protein
LRSVEGVKVSTGEGGESTKMRGKKRTVSLLLGAESAPLLLLRRVAPAVVEEGKGAAGGNEVSDRRRKGTRKEGRRRTR